MYWHGKHVGNCSVTGKVIKSIVNIQLNIINTPPYLIFLFFFYLFIFFAHSILFSTIFIFFNRL